MAVENTDTILPNKRYTRFYQMISPNKGYSYYICHETRATNACMNVFDYVAIA